MKKLIVLLAIALFASAAALNAESNYRTVSHGTAPLQCADGEQTVTFSNGATYTGQFSSCKPVSGYGTFRQGSVELSGYFQSDGNKTVTLTKNGRVIKLSVRTVPR